MLPHQYYQYVGQLAGKISDKRLKGQGQEGLLNLFSAPEVTIYD